MTLEVNAPVSGVIAEIAVKEGETVAPGAVLGAHRRRSNRRRAVEARAGEPRRTAAQGRAGASNRSSAGCPRPPQRASDASNSRLRKCGAATGASRAANAETLAPSVAGSPGKAASIPHPSAGPAKTAA